MVERLKIIIIRNRRLQLWRNPTEGTHFSTPPLPFLQYTFTNYQKVIISLIYDKSPSSTRRKQTPYK